MNASTDWAARVAFACHRHGALAVSRAATAAMQVQGDRDALARLGLDLPATGRMAAAERAQALAYRLMDDAEQALDTAEACIDLARLPRGGPKAPADD